MKNSTKSTSANNSQNNQTANMENNSTITSQAVSEKKVFTYERRVEKVANLKIHPFLVAMNVSSPSVLFKDFYNEFGHIEMPVVTEDGFVITHAQDVLGAQEIGIDIMEITVMKNANEDDVIRFISFKDVIKHGKAKSAFYKTVKLLEHYLNNTEAGKKWKKEFGTTKTRPIAAAILGVSEGTIHSAKKLGDHNPELLAKIDKGEITSTEAFKKVDVEQPIESRKRYNNLFISNVPGKTVEIPVVPVHNLRSIALEWDDLGELKFSINNGIVEAIRNGKSLGEVTHKVTAEGNDKHNGQSHVFIPLDDRFSIQVIIRDAQNLSDDQNLSLAA